MSWNIEILVIETEVADHCDIGMIDIAELKESNIPFWDASSVTYHSGISIANSNGKTIMIDAGCRLGNAIQSLLKDTGDKNVFFVRVADSEICKSFEKGKEKKPGFITSLFNKKTDRKSLDGEQTAWAYLKNNCGLTIDDSGENLNNIKFNYYKLD